MSNSEKEPPRRRSKRSLNPSPEGGAKDQRGADRVAVSSLREPPLSSPLSDHLRSLRTAPFLFVGSGFSRRYLKLETWTGLLRQLAGYTGKPYGYFVTRGNSSPPRIASEIAEALHDIWWEQDQFEASRAEFADAVRTRESPFKVEVAKIVREGLTNLPTTGLLANELELLREAVIDGVITTNFDGLLETLFPEYRVFVGQDQLLFSDPQGVGEIYKIHGSWTSPDSLVLTESDFSEFRERNPYLAATLLTVFVEHPIVFLGYSMNDSHIIEILMSIARILTTQNMPRLADRLIFVHVDTGVSTVEWVRTVIAVDGAAVPVISMTVPHYQEVFRVLAEQRRKFPARLLRQLKEHIYGLVLENEPTTRLFVQDIDAPVLPEGLDVVFGVGLEHRLTHRGYVGLSRRDLLIDALRPVSAYEPMPVVTEALPAILKGSGNVPIFRYLREAGLLDDDGALRDASSVHPSIAQRAARGSTRFMTLPSAHARAQRVLTECGGSFEQLAEHYPEDEVVQFAALIPEEDFPTDQVLRYLGEHLSIFDSIYGSYWAKLVCLCDFYRYARIDARSSRRARATPSA